MRVGLITWGTEGDIRPFYALAHALTRRGHTVQMDYVSVEGRTFDALERTCDVTATPIAGEYFRTHRDALHRAAEESLQRGSPPAQFEQILRDLMDPVADELLARAVAMAGSCDVLAGHSLAHPVATAAAKAAVPFAAVALQPVFRSRRYPPAGAPDGGRLLNPLLWRLADWVMRRALSPRIARQRSALGLPPEPFDASRVGPSRRVLLAVSPTLFARPDDWSDGIVTTGFLAPPEPHDAWTPPDDLRAFLDAGAPVYAGFGSMFTLSDDLAREAVSVFAEAASRAGVRAVIQCPASARGGLAARDDLFFVERAPHVDLFARCSLVVHHGGVGTTWSALRAGRASVVVPHAADQFYWADLLHARGVGARPLRRTRLAARPLAARIRWALDRPELTARAGELSAALAREDGAAATVDALERLAAGDRS